MTNINLLPWREEQREKRQRKYLAFLVGILLSSAFSVYLLKNIVEIKINEQTKRNDFLKGEISLLNNKISEIRKLKQQLKAIEIRTDIILNLQESRNIATHVMDELVRVIPLGVYLFSIEKQGFQLKLNGHSDSNNNVVNMMRLIESSSWLNEPVVESIVTQDKSTMSRLRFTINITIRPSVDGHARLAMKRGSMQ